MPIYEFLCPVCDVRTEVIRPIGSTMKCICGIEMKRVIHYPAMVKVRGMGGYPSRRKYVEGTAPYSGSAKEWNPYVNNAFDGGKEGEHGD